MTDRARVGRMTHTRTGTGGGSGKGTGGATTATTTATATATTTSAAGAHASPRRSCVVSGCPTCAAQAGPRRTRIRRLLSTLSARLSPSKRTASSSSSASASHATATHTATHTATPHTASSVPSPSPNATTATTANNGSSTTTSTRTRRATPRKSTLAVVHPSPRPTSASRRSTTTTNNKTAASSQLPPPLPPVLIPDSIDLASFPQYSDYGERFSIPHYVHNAEPIKHIDIHTLAYLLKPDGRLPEKPFFDKLLLIDCRFTYEFKGGHIKSALNLYSKEQIDHLFWNGGIRQWIKHGQKIAVVFYCELSSTRAPQMASYLRNQDRNLNIDEYPRLSYPELYVLHGGYRAFYGAYKQLCDPKSYITLLDKRYDILRRQQEARRRIDFGTPTKFSQIGSMARPPKIEQWLKAPQKDCF